MAFSTFNPWVAPTKSSNKPEFKILKADFGDGYTQPVADGMNHIRNVVTLSWDCLKPAQADAIENFIRLRLGTIPFWYQVSDSAEALKWTCEDYTRTQGTPITMELVLRQSFAFG